MKSLRRFILLALAAFILFVAGFAAQKSNPKIDYLYLEATTRGNEGSLDDMYMLLRHAAAVDPSDPYVAGRLAELSILTSNPDSLLIEDSYQKMLYRTQADPTNVPYAEGAASFGERIGRFDDAIAIWKSLEKLQPSKTDPSMNLAKAYLKRYMRDADTTDYKSALAIFNRLEDAMGVNVPLSIEKIQAYLLRNDSLAIIRQTQALAESAPVDPQAMLLIGEVHEMLQNPDSAIAYYNRAGAVAPENGEIYIAKANFYLEKKDTTEYYNQIFHALEAPELDFSEKFKLLTNTTIRLYPDSTFHNRIESMFALMQELNPGEAELHKLYGDFKEVINQPEAAAEQLEYAIALDPTEPLNWLQLYNRYLGMDDIDKALSVARRASLHDPENPQFKFMLAFPMMRQDRYAEALAALDSIDFSQIKNNEFISNVMATQGDILYKLDRFDEASAKYKEVLNVNPDNFMAMNNYAYYCAEKGKELELAEHYSEMTTEIDPTNATYLDTYAWVLFKRGKYEEAAKAMDRTLDAYALELEGGSDHEPSAEVYEHAGDIYFHVNDLDRALEYWKKALDIEPDNDILKKKVKSKKYISK